MRGSLQVLTPMWGWLFGENATQRLVQPAAASAAGTPAAPPAGLGPALRGRPPPEVAPSPHERVVLCVGGRTQVEPIFRPLLNALHRAHHPVRAPRRGASRFCSN
jgi:hypothetical protein